MPKPRALTYDELIKMGATPDQAGPSPMTLQQLQATGATPDPSSSGSVDLRRAYPTKIGATDAAALGLLQGASLGWSDEMTGAYSDATRRPGVRPGPAFALSDSDTPAERRIKLEALDRSLPLKDPLAYEPMRDRMRAAQAQAAQERPVEYKAGEIGGGLLPSVLIPGGTQVRLAPRIGSALASGTALGAVSGMGATNAPVTSAQGAREALEGAGMGAAGAFTGTLAPEILRTTGRGLQRVGIDSGRRHLINSKTLTTQAPLEPEAVRAALTSGSILPGTMVGGTFKRLKARASVEGKKLADAIQTMEDAGILGPGYREVSDQLAAEGQDVAERTLGSSVPARFQSLADEMLQKGGLPKPEPHGVVTDKALRIGRAEEIKRDLQREAKKEYRRVGGDTALGEAKMKAAEIMNRLDENAIERGAARFPANTPAAEAAESFKPLKARVGPLIGARDEAELGAAKAAQHAELGLPAQISMAEALAEKGVGPAIMAGLKTWPLRQLLNRASSTISTGTFWPGVGMERIGQSMGRAPRYGTELGSSVGRALGMRPEPPAAPGIPEGGDLDYQRWLLEQELQGKALPDGARLKRLLTKGKR